MSAAFFLMLREGLEAALIVGIIAAYLVRIGRRDALPRIWLGVVTAVALSVAAGVAVVLTVKELPLVVQETFEGLAGVTAVGVLTWMIFWMRRHGRSIKGELERGVDVALTADRSFALAGLAFVAVLREGLETVLFMLAILASAGAALPTALGSVGGLVVAIAIGWAIFAAGVRVNLSRFFTVTGVVLVFVSAGLIAFAIHEFGEAGLIANTGTTFDLGAILPETSPLGSVLAGLFGYRSQPTPLELTGYLVYLLPVLALFLFGDRIRRLARPSAAAA
jgi:high-affinity iron transporter